MFITVIFLVATPTPSFYPLFKLCVQPKHTAHKKTPYTDPLSLFGLQTFCMAARHHHEVACPTKADNEYAFFDILLYT